MVAADFFDVTKNYLTSCSTMSSPNLAERGFQTRWSGCRLSWTWCTRCGVCCRGLSTATMLPAPPFFGWLPPDLVHSLPVQRMTLSSFARSDSPCRRCWCGNPLSQSWPFGVKMRSLDIGLSWPTAPRTAGICGCCLLPGAAWIFWPSPSGVSKFCLTWPAVSAVKSLRMGWCKFRLMFLICCSSSYSICTGDLVSMAAPRSLWRWAWSTSRSATLVGSPCSRNSHTWESSPFLQTCMTSLGPCISCKHKPVWSCLSCLLWNRYMHRQ